MIRQTISTATADLLASPRPLLYLDTCDLVNLLQVLTLTTIPVSELQAATRLLVSLASNPQRCQPVVTYVTDIEFPQKTDPTNSVYQQDSLTTRMPPDEVAYQLQQIDAHIDRIHQVSKELGLPLPVPTVYARLGLLADLQTIVQMLLDACWMLEREQVCVDAALLRVFAKMRPSHKREVKDSIHLEHCLELARRLRQNGFTGTIVFTSANKNDYGPAVAHQPHDKLRPDFAAVQMLYFERLGSALAHLGI